MTTPEQIQRDIEGTRRALSSDVDRLAEKVSPGKVVGRRVERVKTGAVSLRERVMGSLPDPQDVKGHAGDAASSVSDSASNAVSAVGDAVSDAPRKVRQQTQGNPLGAGLVAFGVGLVISSLLPASDVEKQVAQRAEETARGPVQEKAKEMAQPMLESAKESAQQVKETATTAVSDTVDEARSAAEDVKAPLQQ